MNNKVQIKISDILEMLKNGQTREDIATHYGITKSAMKEIFQHPQLKGKKTRKVVEPTYLLVDDVTEGATVANPGDTQDDNTADVEDSSDVLEVDADITADNISPWSTALDGA